MKKLFLIFLISVSTSAFTEVKSQEPPFNIVQVKPPQHIQDAYQNWINTNEFWLYYSELNPWLASGIFWKVSGDGVKQYNYDNNLTSSYIVPVNMPNAFGGNYISAIIISNDGSVDFIYLYGYTSWYQYVKTAQ